MDTVHGSAIHVPTDDVPELGSSAVAYLETLSREQARFLSATMEARRRLGDDPGQLAVLAALHGRLTQQFFDAQRTILRRRAETDARVRSIEDAIDDETEALLHEARAEATQRSSVRDSAFVYEHLVPVTEGGRDDASVGDDARSIRQQIADLVTTVVRSGDEAQSFAEVINGAFLPDEPDGAAAQRRLQEVLDDWWSSEKQENRAAIDDATARAAMRLHVARLEAAEVAGAEAGVPITAGVDSADTGIRRDDVADITVVEETLAEVPCVEVARVEVALIEAAEIEGGDADRVEVGAAGVIPTDALTADQEMGSDAEDGDGIGVGDTLDLRVVPDAGPEDDDEDDEPYEPEPAPAAAAAHIATPRSQDLLAALERTDHIGLDSVLASLLDAYDEPAIPPSAVPDSSERAAVIPPAELGEPYEAFWAETAAVQPVRPTRRWVSTQVMLPAAAVVGLVAVVMAWVG